MYDIAVPWLPDVSRTWIYDSLYVLFPLLNLPLLLLLLLENSYSSFKTQSKCYLLYEDVLEPPGRVHFLCSRTICPFTRIVIYRINSFATFFIFISVTSVSTSRAETLICRVLYLQWLSLSLSHGRCATNFIFQMYLVTDVRRCQCG